MYRFLLSPRWIVAHILLVCLVALCIRLGFWQLQRLDERRQANALVAERMATPARPLGQLVQDAGQGPAGALDYRRAKVAGRYLEGEQLLVGPRTLGGRPVYHVLTPLEYDGGVVVVERGWIPYDPDASTVGHDPPAGPVVVGGILLPGEPAGPAAGPAPAAGGLEVMPRADLERLSRQLPGPLVPALLQLEGQDPPQPGPLPVPLPPPRLDEGPHLSYAGQWFLFALVGLVGYPLLVRQRARERVIDRGPERQPVAAPSAAVSRGADQP